MFIHRKSMFSTIRTCLVKNEPIFMCDSGFCYMILAKSKLPRFCSGRLSAELRGASHPNHAVGQHQKAIMAKKCVIGLGQLQWQIRSEELRVKDTVNMKNLCDS